jgi:hypothetical protein
LKAANLVELDEGKTADKTKVIFTFGFKLPNRSRQGSITRYQGKT